MTRIKRSFTCRPFNGRFKHPSKPYLLRCVAFCAGAVLLLLGGCTTIHRKAPDAGKAERVVALAESLQGTPYRYGGKSTRGFDCSGFVYYVYREAAGIHMPRTSRAQFKVSKHVPLGQEKPSDLLFYDINGRGISHVGIYLGKGKFIHAPKSGGKVKISDANKPYWRKHFRGVRRVL